MNKRGKILLTFDVEEFDIPLEYNIAISAEEQLEVGKKGLDAIAPILNANDISTTLFTTANFAVHFPAEIKLLAHQHEIASHTYYHSKFEVPDLLNSKLKLEEITGNLITGLRMPRLRKVNMEDVKRAGYEYDSSINPTWIPGRYNNSHLSRVTYIDEGMVRLPASVSPTLRIPLFWLAFKNMPYTVFKSLAIQTLQKDGYLSLYFHPWEFTDISKYNLPSYIKRWSGEILLKRLLHFIEDLKPFGDFVKVQTYLNKSR